MKIKMIGLGKMGYNLALNLIDHGHEVVGFDVNEEIRSKAIDDGINCSESLEQIVKDTERNILWVMLPAGRITQSVIKDLIKISRSGDIIIDGGNSDYRDTKELGELASEQGIYLLDVGTSGGVSGARSGASYMIGGDGQAFKSIEVIFNDTAVDGGYIYTGKTASGHYLKMVHNAMLYGMMQTLGEGFELLEASEFDYDLAEVAKALNQSSVIRGWLLGLVANAFEKNPGLNGIQDKVSASKTTNWTLESACELGIPIPVISLSLMMRLRSTQESSFSGKLIASLRDEVGGHKAIKKSGE